MDHAEVTARIDQLVAQGTLGDYPLNAHVIFWEGELTRKDTKLRLQREAAREALMREAVEAARR